MIRDATEADIPRLVEMGQRFHTVLPYDASFEPETFERSLRHLIEGADATIKVLDIDGLVGMAAAIAYPLFFCASHTVGQELFWWVEPEHRGTQGLRLLGAVEAWGREMDAKSFVMADLPGLQSLGPLYERRGYQKGENMYVRSL